MRALLASVAMSALLTPFSLVASEISESDSKMHMEKRTSLTAVQAVIAPIGAFTAIGDMENLTLALNKALNAGLSIAECKEILVQMYAYAGFPRSLNALGLFMKVLDERKQRGMNDVKGQSPGPLPPAADMLAVGSKNQTQLIGAPVKGPLFEFAPAIDQYLKTHLFGDIFARDNLDWQSRELATVGALAALTGTESQLQSHLKVSLNVGLSPAQLRQLPTLLAQANGADAADRMQKALDAVLANLK